MITHAKCLSVVAELLHANKVVRFNPHQVTSVAAPVYQRMLSYSRAVQ